MTEPLYELVGRPELTEPVLVLGLEGWVDAGFGAAGATSHLLEVTDTTVVARFDADLLVDHRSRRPMMHLVEGVNTGLTWPSIEVRHGHDDDGRDVLLLVGAEPDIRWHAFAADVVALCDVLGVRLVVGLGAYPAPVPHTRPGRLATTATTEDLASRAGQVRATLDVPAGIGGAIEEQCSAAGLPAVGLWAQVPHYASAMAFPDASAALVEGLARIAGLSLDAGALHEAGRLLRVRLDALVAENEEHTEMVRSLEAAHDAELAAPGGVIAPGTGERLAAELEQYLREQGDA